MSLNAKNAVGGNANRPEPLEPGTYPARVVQIVGLGLQPQEYAGEKKPDRDMIYVTYELLDEFLKDDKGNDREDKPRWMSEDFALFHLEADKAKSTKRYYALDPEEKHNGDWAKLIATPCMITLIRNEKRGRIYNNVSSVSSMRSKEAERASPLVNPPVVFDFYEPDMAIFNNLPEWLKTRMKESPAYPGSSLQEFLEEKKAEVEEDIY